MITALPSNSMPDAAQPAMAGSTDQDLLRHLLEVETGAAALVEDAQAEADRRVAEFEARSRARYDEAYAREAVDLEARYQREYEAVKTEYQRRLDEYRENLETMTVHRDDFFKLASSLFFGEH
jgi:ABC-type phosphate transport system auxiliary subunit